MAKDLPRGDGDKRHTRRDDTGRHGRFTTTKDGVARSAASGKFVEAETCSPKTQRVGRAMASASKRTGAFETRTK
jgi:hypothetical protein